MKKINSSNYFEVWKSLSRKDGIPEIPVELLQSHETVKGIHEAGGWEAIDSDTDLHEFRDLYFESLQDFIEKHAPEILSDSTGAEDEGEKPKPKRRKKAKEEIPLPSEEEEPQTEEEEIPEDEKFPPDDVHETEHHEKPVKENGKRKRAPKPQSNQVNSFPAEYKAIRKVAHLHGKERSRSQLLRILKSLQKDILEHRIRKTSPYAEEINHFQRFFILQGFYCRDKLLLNMIDFFCVW